jgi:hypothetical protein
MSTQTVNASLRGFGASPTTATLVVERLTPGQRLGRAAAALGLGVAAAAVALPIPIVHFVLVPGSLLVGLILAAVRVSQGEIVRTAEGACPFCGTRQRLGLAGRKYRLPRRVHCSSCGQDLDIDPMS